MIDTLILTITTLSILLVIYHHAGYPMLLMKLGKRKDTTALPAVADADLPSVSMLIPAYDEAEWIADKINNLAALDYPADRLKVIIACDGCSDDTAEIARRTAALPHCQHLDVDVREFTVNRGKVAVVNDVMGSIDSDLTAMSDVSALISIDALRIAASQFQNPETGVLNSHYRLLNPGSDGEAAYWNYQSRIKACEAALGSSIGSHGAFYVIRTHLFSTLPADTINDDFVLPMQIVADGYRAVYDDRINAIELEEADDSMDGRRRRRIAAGNFQQLVRLVRLMSPRYGATAFNFISGKAMRVMMPPLMIIALAGSVYLAADHAVFALIAAVQSFAYSLAIVQMLIEERFSHRITRALSYLVRGHASSFIGSLRYVTGRERGAWKRVTAETSDNAESNKAYHINPITSHVKRSYDIAFALCGLMLTLPLFPLIALAIKLDSPGPVFFRQTRVGKAHPHMTEIFEMIKFRTMRTDAESDGAQWARKKDSRITAVGLFLRKTRLDELPQFINVLRGDMSIIGPRPERPEFYNKLEDAIPLYSERTFGVMPGISGLAQVNQGYDSCIEDVRSKVGYDHRYAMSMTDPVTALKMDVGIMMKTLLIMVTGRGQ